MAIDFLVLERTIKMVSKICVYPDRIESGGWTLGFKVSASYLGRFNNLQVVSYPKGRLILFRLTWGVRDFWGTSLKGTNCALMPSFSIGSTCGSNKMVYSPLPVFWGESVVANTSVGTVFLTRSTIAVISFIFVVVECGACRMATVCSSTLSFFYTEALRILLRQNHLTWCRQSLGWPKRN